ncbi:4-hydroxy 2-oxovalerate aldolase [Prauserella shujinwangii]|uniref:4-hydroxy 2-oxovalerate aldolase n=1 Tax=Prauserella shujinwangii TaxID=1453103 RepID=A0A2T0M0P9_9PSEU|nr:3-hydroxy-3-methylglutaryl-CoA lyase [Prauserella shujinwangii]PRX50120.1 4-hydroxy 2-oxovalerate aldolase [Prauserella shujinwangii]
MNIVNIDVTLRDGGYRNGFEFPLDYAIEHAKLSVESGFDWIEIAYRKGSFAPIPTLGLTGRGDDDYISAVANEIGADRVCVILHPKNIDRDDLPAMHRAGARLVRVCLPSDDPDPGLACIRQAKDLGFTVSANLTRVSRLPARRVVELAAASSDAGCDVVYLADSNGSLAPSEIAELVAATKAVVEGGVGLHAHNNLGLALANAISAIDAGATWIDSAVQGMGKGPGNLIAEQWLAYLDRSGVAGPRVQLGPALELADLLLCSIPESKPSLPLPDLVLGQFDLSVEHRKSVARNHRTSLATARELASRGGGTSHAGSGTRDLAGAGFR